MAGGPVGGTYSWGTAAVFIFNLIVGVGSLTLPHAFQEAGMILGSLFLLVIMTFSFMTSTWVVESMAMANALFPEKTADEEIEEEDLLPGEEGSVNDGGQTDRLLRQASSHDSTPIGSCHLDRRVELGTMCDLFLGFWGGKIFNTILSVYLLGDLAIYAVFVPKSVVEVTGPLHLGSLVLSKQLAYRFYLVIFSVCTVPFVFFNFQKTKWLQISTIITRNLAISAMIILSIVYIAQGNGASFGDIKFFNVLGLPTLFGSAVYAFMCHHSIPGFIVPIDRKRHMSALFLLDFIIILLTYIGLSISANIAFGGDTIDSTYSTNWKKNNIGNVYVADLLALFPLFTITTNFPLIGITLRNNLMSLIPWKWSTQGGFRHRVAMALIATVPPLLIAFATDNVSLLVQVTGAYPGLGIMFVIPMGLVFVGRRKMANRMGKDFENPFASPFKGMPWIILVAVWSVICVVLETVSLFV